MKKYIILLWLGLLSACSLIGHGLANQYYYLPHSHFIPPLQNYHAIDVQLQLASYLHISSMVVGNTENTVIFTNQNQWIGDLAKAIRNNLSNRLNELGQKERHFFTIDTNHRHTKKLVIFIERFQGNLNGTARVTGYAKLLNQEDEVQKANDFDIEVKQQQNGYPAMLQALDQALKLAAQRIYSLF